MLTMFILGLVRAFCHVSITELGQSVSTPLPVEKAEYCDQHVCLCVYMRVLLRRTSHVPWFVRLRVLAAWPWRSS